MTIPLDSRWIVVKKAGLGSDKTPSFEEKTK